MAEDVHCHHGNNISIDISKAPVTVPSFMAMKTQKGTEQCPLFIHTTPGQRINITLTNFNRFTEDQSGVPGCYKFIEIFEMDKKTVIPECMGGARQRLVYTSRSHVIEVHILARNDVYFFLEFKGILLISIYYKLHVHHSELNILKSHLEKYLISVTGLQSGVWIFHALCFHCNIQAL